MGGNQPQQPHGDSTTSGSGPVPVLCRWVDCLYEDTRRLHAKLAGRAATIRRLQVVWDMAEILVYSTDQDEVLAAIDTVREAIDPSPAVDLEERTRAIERGLLPEE